MPACRREFAADFRDMRQQLAVSVPGAEGQAASRCFQLESRTKGLAKRSNESPPSLGRPLRWEG